MSPRPEEQAAFAATLKLTVATHQAFAAARCVVNAVRRLAHDDAGRALIATAIDHLCGAVDEQQRAEDEALAALTAAEHAATPSRWPEQ